MQRSEERGGTAKLWVPLVLVAGFAVGLLLASLPTPVTDGMGRHMRPFGPQFESAEDVDVVLSTVGIALLVALLVLYIKVFGETRANFAAGLVVVFAALLLQSIAASPLVYGPLGHSAGTLGPFLLFADVFKVVAFTAFLYLSLE